MIGLRELRKNTLIFSHFFSATVNPLLSPMGCLFISSSFEGGLNRDGCGGGGAYLRGWGLFKLEKMMVSVL